jgi:hypothetical protein
MMCSCDVGYEPLSSITAGVYRTPDLYVLKTKTCATESVSHLIGRFGHPVLLLSF